MIGQTLGRYRLEASLGRGGMAEVFRARDERLGRTVAVKVILPAFASEPHFAERFLREARMVASLEHPHILPVYDSGDEGGVPYLVMPYLQGGTLVERMAAGALPPDTALRWIGELAMALDAAHSHGVLHRDVKPANVLLGAGDRALLADFGIAKSGEAATQLTATGVVIGTPTYMAPELAQGRPASPASDLYALAVLAYEMLTGAPPFSGESALSLLHQHVTTPPPSVRTRATLPADLDAVFARALAKDPAQRPASARQFARELEDALAPVAPGTPASEPTIRTARTVHMTTPVPAPASSSAARAQGGGRSLWPWIAGLAVLAIALLLWRLLGTPPAPAVGKPAAPPAAIPASPAPAPVGPAQPDPAPAEVRQPLESPAGKAPETRDGEKQAPSAPAPPAATAVAVEAPAAEAGAVDAGAGAARPFADLERRLQEVQRRARESTPKEALAWLNAELRADGLPPARAALQTALTARRLWGAAAAKQVLENACGEGITEACAELRKRPFRRP
jgi:serine/threonine-protein kinase